MNASLSLVGAPELPTDEQYARNLVDGIWRFPAAPYEYEIRNPADSTVTTVVPLSSRFDVSRAVSAARVAAVGWAADHDLREGLLTRLALSLERLAPQLAALQAVETGLDPADSLLAAVGTARLATAVVNAARPTMPPGVTGHILSWGLPLADAVAAVLPDLAAGRTAVVKPSLRAPLSVVALAHLATELGFPPGVLNVVQGTGEDVGAALCGTPGLASLHVRAGGRALAQAARATSVTGVPLRLLRSGGNVAVVGTGADPAAVAAAIADAVRVHSTGGPLGLPVLAVHRDVADAVMDAVLDAVGRLLPAPLPTESLRRRAMARVGRLRGGGVDGGVGGRLPDDVRHRMGWYQPPTVIYTEDRSEPLGPVLSVRTWMDAGDLVGAFAEARYAHGQASVWGVEDISAAHLPHTVLLHDRGPAAALAAGALPSAWIGGTEEPHR